MKKTIITLVAFFAIGILNAFGNFPKDDTYAFFRAAENGDEATLYTLIAKGIDVNMQDELGGTALLYAASYGHLECAKLLISAGAGVDPVHPKGGGTPLQAAAWEGHPEEVQFLLDVGANVNAIDKEGRTALHSAVSKSNIYVVRILLDSEADTSIKNNKGETALDWAKNSGYIEIAEMLEG